MCAIDTRTCVSSYSCILRPHTPLLILLLYICPHIYVLIHCFIYVLIYICPHTSALYMSSYIYVLILLLGPTLLTYVSSYYCRPIYMSSYIYVLILLLCPTRAATGGVSQIATFRSVLLCVRAVSSYYCTFVSSYYCMCVSSYYCRPIYMSSYIYVLKLLLGTTRAATGEGAQSATFRSTRCCPTRCLSITRTA